jgi:serine/threonine-protein kinase
MSTLFRAIDRHTARAVALKVPHPHACAIAQIDNEVAALRRLDHPAIVPLLGRILEADRVPALVVPLLGGADAGSVIRTSGGLSPELTLAIAQQTAHALTHAHRRGVVHGDIKPDNLILEIGPQGAVRSTLIDFGLAVLDGQRDLRVSREYVLGTAGFVAPECIASAALPGTASDVYGLGALIFWLLAGHAPHRGHSPEDVMSAQLSQPTTSLLDLGVGASRELAALVGQMLARDPAVRPSAKQCARRLLSIKASTSRRAAATFGLDESPTLRLRPLSLSAASVGS